MQAEIGIIGGSGLYTMPGLINPHQITVTTPFGDPSDVFMVGELEGRQVAFLARHGRGHRILPSELNFRANIFAMKKLGVERIISVSAVGSLKLEHKPTDFVVPDQFIDRTSLRTATFFGDGIVGHVSFADPVCATVAKAIPTEPRVLEWSLSKAASTSIWRARNFPRAPSPTSIAVGALTSSA
jgi:5'-methylthioadenosine phosphorylase